MKEFTINGKTKLCFVLKEGEANNIVVKYEALAPVDLKRFLEMEQQGGDLMRVMRDTTLDNGVNALKMYEGLLVSVPVKKVEKAASVTNDVTTTKTAAPKKKRGPGRPRKNS